MSVRNNPDGSVTVSSDEDAMREIARDEMADQALFAEAMKRMEESGVNEREMAKDVVIDNRTGRKSFRINGEEFPWYITEEGPVVTHEVFDRLDGGAKASVVVRYVTVRLLVDNVSYFDDDSTPRSRNGLEPPPAKL